MKQEQSGELKASLGANKLTADQLRIRELERELSIAKTERDILMGTSINLFFRKAFTRNRDFESLQKKIDGFLLKAAVREGIFEVSRMPFPQFR